MTEKAPVVPVPTTELDPGQITDPKLAPQPPVDPGNTPPAAKTVAKTPEQEAAEKKAADEKLLADAEAVKKAADEAAAKEREGWQKEYVQMDNPDAQAAVDVMKEAGVSPIEANAIFAKAIESKKLEDIDWATLESKIGPAKTRLVRNGIDKYFADVVSVQVATTEKAYEIVGGQENWLKVRDWAQAQEKADPQYAAKVKGYRQAIELGGFAAEAAVKALRADYEAHPKNGGLGQQNMLRGDTPAAPSGLPLSRADYNTELHKAYRRGAKDAEIQALHNRRRLGMKAGI